MAFRFSDSEIHMSKAGLACVLDQINIIHVTAYVVATARQLAKDHGLCGHDAVHIARAVVVGATFLPERMPPSPLRRYPRAFVLPTPGMLHPSPLTVRAKSSNAEPCPALVPRPGRIDSTTG